MIWPVKEGDYWISQGYSSSHRALDFASHGGKFGLPIIAPVSGTVIGRGNDPVGGLYLIIRDSQGYEHYTGHHERIHVSPGQSVRQGQHIADMGATGQATGAHTHYQIRRNNHGALIDPRMLYNERNKERTVSKVTRNELNHLYRFYLGRGVTDYGKNVYQGKQTFEQTVVGLKSSNTFKSLLNRARDGKLDPVAHLPRDMRRVFLNPLKVHNAELERQLDEVVERHNITLAEKDDLKTAYEYTQARVNELNEELRNVKASSDTENLNALGALLQWLIVRLGLKEKS